jgi:hypothetical protein
MPRGCLQRLFFHLLLSLKSERILAMEDRIDSARDGMADSDELR